MKGSVVFVIGSPRSGSTLLARMIGSHSMVYARPEPHLLTPLAHLGYYAKVEKAPYDAVLAAEAQREFIEHLPKGEDDYRDACRSYADTLYDRMLSTQPSKKLILDKTPAYALVLDFIARIYPEARFVVLTRHPLAIFSSYAESFFNGDYEEAHAYNPILERYVPAIAGFLRDRPVPIHHVVYERLVAAPEPELQQIFEFLRVPHEPEAVHYGNHQPTEKGLGDPIGVARHSRPSTGSVDKWATEIANAPAYLTFCQRMIERLDPDDLAIWGHPVETLWDPLLAADPNAKVSRSRLDRYRLERMLIVRLRRLVRSNRLLRRCLAKLRLAADILLRE